MFGWGVSRGYETLERPEGRDATWFVPQRSCIDRASAIACDLSCSYRADRAKRGAACSFAAPSATGGAGCLSLSGEMPVAGSGCACGDEKVVTGRRERDIATVMVHVSHGDVTWPAALIPAATTDLSSRFHPRRSLRTGRSRQGRPRAPRLKHDARPCCRDLSERPRPPNASQSSPRAKNRHEVLAACTRRASSRVSQGCMTSAPRLRNGGGSWK